MKIEGMSFKKHSNSHGCGRKFEHLQAMSSKGSKRRLTVFEWPDNMTFGSG